MDQTSRNPSVPSPCTSIQLTNQINAYHSYDGSISMSSDSIHLLSPRGNPRQDHLDDGAPAQRGSQLAPEPPQLGRSELPGEAALPSGLQGLGRGCRGMPRAPTFFFSGLFLSQFITVYNILNKMGTWKRLRMLRLGEINFSYCMKLYMK